MISKQTIKYSIESLKKRKSRSFFTILSIFLGIATIFIFVSFGWGLYNYTQDMIEGSASDKIIIREKGIGMGLSEDFSLSEEDLDVVKDSSGVEEVAGIMINAAKVENDEEEKNVFLMGFNPEKTKLIFSNFNAELSKGRELRKRESNKVILGYNYQVEDKIFSKKIKINDKLIVQGKKLRVVGFIDKIGNPQDDSNIYLTEKSYKNLYNKTKNEYDWVIARVSKGNIDSIEKTIEDIEDNLLDLKNVEKGEERFYVQSFKEMIESYSGALNIIIGFVILIAFISIIVSAVNTSNTMITSVLERTREIGIMKAIGAKNSEIFGIFLFESGFLGFIGGIIGILLGLGFTEIASIVLENLGWDFLSPYYNPWLFIGSLTFAVLTGAISGVIPAYKASKENPVDALRYE